MRENKLLKWFLLFLFFSFLINISALVLIHEEPRRGIITFEMMKSHNFLQPTVLLEPYFKKPPFHNWVLVLSSFLLGGISELSLRLPSSLSVILTSIVIFAVGKRLLSSRGAAFGAIVFSTFYVVLIGYGSKCEPDTLFTLLVASSSLLWLYFMERGRELEAWVWGYLLTSFALLTKGLPALQFFAFLVGAYVFVTGKKRVLVTFRHLLGAVLGLVPFLFWLFSVESGVAVKTLFSEVISRAPGEVPLFKSLKNYVSYPLRLFLATFPWSFVLIYYSLKKGINAKPAGVVERVLITAFLLDALLYWLFPGSRLRYLMPALPLLALYIGEKVASVQVVHKRAKEILRFTVQFIVIVGIVAGVFVTKNPSFVLQNTVVFLAFLYGIYFFFVPRFNFTYLVPLVGVLMLIFRGFYGAYYLSSASFRYPPVREVAREVADLTVGKPLFTKVKYLQLCFYVEKYRDKPLPYSSSPPEGSYFLSGRKEEEVVKEIELGRHRFYLCFKRASTRRGRTFEAESLKTTSQ
ncbi:MAG: glycosyltransferase family 39 protein [Desulfurobacteriaceae bacterium]